MTGHHSARSRRKTSLGAVGISIALALVAAACGGGKKSAAQQTGLPAEATTSEVVTTTSTTPTGDTTASPSTTAAVATTAVTSGRSTTTAEKTTASTLAPLKPKSVTAGIVNVTAPASTVAPSGPAVQPGGSVTELLPGILASFDPVVLNIDGSTDGSPAFAIYDPLLYSDTGGDGSIRPGIADGLTSTDGLVWTLKLKPNIKFSDGTLYDAAVVKFNWLRHQDPNNHSTKASTANTIKTMDVIDPVTLKLTLTAVNVQFPRSATGLALIGSPKAITAEGDQYGANPVGAGPFVLKQFVRDSQITMVRNTTYWNPPRPYLDQLIFRPVTDEQQKINSFTVGEANMLWTNVVPSADVLQKSGGVQYPIASNGGFNLIFNVTKPPFSDIRLRKAVTLAIDRADYVKVIDNNVIGPMNSIFANSSSFYDPNIQQLAYDPTQAQTLFDQLASENGGPLQLQLATYDVTATRTQAEYIQGALQKFRNVKVTINAAAINTETALLNQRSYQFAVYNNHFDDPDPLMLNIFVCTANPSPIGFCDPKLDADAADSRQTFDVNQRIADFKDIQKIIYANVPILFYERTYTWVYAAVSVQGVALYQNAIPFYDRLWIRTH